MKPPKHSDPNDFAARVQAYEAARDKGLVFQADGTLGGVTLRKKRKSTPAGRILSLFFVFVTLFLLKSAIFFAAGPSKYNTTLLPYTNGTAAVDRVISALMGAGPVTIFAADRMGDVKRETLALARRILPNY